MKIKVPAEVVRLFESIDIDNRIKRISRQLKALTPLPLTPEPSQTHDVCDGCLATCPGSDACIWHQAGRRPAM
jgi:hypothetical protein